MPDLTRLMNAAAETPDGDLDMGALLQRGRKLRLSRAISASALSLLVLSGGALAAIQISGEGTTERKGAPAPAQDPTDSSCKDKDRGADQNHIRYCIAQGTYDETEWKWYAHLNNEGDLCESFFSKVTAGSSCGPPLKANKTIEVGGLASWDGSGPILDIVTSEFIATALVETSDGDRLPIELFDAPEELEIYQRFGLYFDLPKKASRVLAVDKNGNVIGHDEIDTRMTTITDDLMDLAQTGGMSISFGSKRGEPWDLAGKFPSGSSLPCLMFGLGNDPKAADVELGVRWCPDSGDANALHIEQAWWSGLEDLAPLFGSIPRETAIVELAFEGGTSEVVSILESPQEGMWPERIYETNFVVAFPPLGAQGQVVARADDGSVLSTWDFCLEEEATKGVDYAACDDQTEFWTPPE